MATTVLIADDSPYIRTAYRRILETQDDLEVSAVVDDGRAAVEAAEGISVDVAILDVRMPRLDGITAGKKIREASPSTSLVIVSAFDDWTYIQDLVSTDPGGKAYILKNSLDDIGELVRVVRQVLKGYVIFDQTLVDKLVGYYERHTSPEAREFSRDHLSVISLYSRGFEKSEMRSRLEISSDQLDQCLSDIFTHLGIDQSDEQGNQVATTISFLNRCVALDA
jgi:DNA-binding NarL/FixJ family response regulator